MPFCLFFIFSSDMLLCSFTIYVQLNAADFCSERNLANKANSSLRLICCCSLPDSVLVVKFYVIDFLPMLNFLTDPLIYGIRMREIRRAYRRMLVAALPCGWCRARRLVPCSTTDRAASHVTGHDRVRCRLQPRRRDHARRRTLVGASETH